MPTIKDVARRAGVSITTASYAINNTGTVSDETRKRVLKAAEELNYSPNAFARHLKAQRTRTIGVFITRFGGAFYEDILEGIHDIFLETEYELIVCPETHSERRIFAYRQVDGAIVFDRSIRDEQILKAASPKFPIVVMDRCIEAEYVFPLLLNNKQGVTQAFAHLYQQGLRRLAYISGAPDSFDNTERTEAFITEATRHGLPVRIYPGNFTEISGYEAAQHIIAGDLPDAVFCANDQMAIGFIRAMHEQGLDAPRDIAVVGFDDILISRYMQPPLSTVSAPRREWGRTAARWLLRYLDHMESSPPQRIPTTFVPRASSLKNPAALE